MAEIAAAVLIVAAMLALTGVVWAVIRQSDGPTARHYANLALPCGLMPVLAALVLVGPAAGLGTAVLILILQTVSSVAESHLAGRVALLRRKRRQPR
jgi:branched-subunit amino acid transport protein AzlD